MSGLRRAVLQSTDEEVKKSGKRFNWKSNSICIDYNFVDTTENNYNNSSRSSNALSVISVPSPQE